MMLSLRSTPDVRQDLASLETPCALVDLDRLSANLDAMASYAVVHGLALRPHVKTHKSPRIAAEQMRLGAVGLTCATPRELEVMSGVSNDLLLAYPPIGDSKLRRLMELPREARVSVGLDSMFAIDGLMAAARVADRDIDVLVEVDLGMHRVGVQSAEEALALAMHLRQCAPLRFAGVMFYPGHIREHVSEHEGKLERLARDVKHLVQVLADAGLPPRVVSGGSTPLAWRMHEVPGMTEVRPGTYVYNDRTTAEIGSCTWEDIAFTVLGTVVSTAVPGQAVVDCGAKALGREPMRGAAGEGFGALLDRPEVVVARMSEEHGILDLSATDWRPRVGDRVRIVPNHVCIVVHLNDVIHGVRGDQVETSWPVAARGRQG